MSTQNGLAVASNSSLVLDDERMELLRKTIANEAPPLEFELFVADCNRRGLDPFAKQIYLIPRNVKSRDGKWETKWTAQTSIDGYRLIADRTGKYAGSDEPVYDREDAEHPNKATVTVWKMVGGQRVAFSSSARWDEYCQTTRDGNPAGLWARMPYVMLAKCAESAALRKAFPQELSGLYTREEMEQADNEPTTHQPVAAGQSHTEQPQLDDRERANRRYFAVVNARGLTEDERHALQRIAYGVESANDMSADQLRQLADRIEARSLDELRAAIQHQAELDAQPSEHPEPEPETTEPHPRIQEAIDQREANWIAAMEGAATAAELARIGAEIGMAEMVEEARERLRANWNKHSNRIQSNRARPVNTLIDQAPVQAGEPGNDKHTN